MANHERTDSSPSRSRPIQAGSLHPRTESTLSGSPSRSSATARLATTIGSPGRSPSSGPQQDARTHAQEPLAGASGTSAPGPGPSSLSQALRGTVGQSPSRTGTPTIRDTGRGTKRLDSPDRRGQQADYGSFTPTSYTTQLGRSPAGKEDIEVLKRHLVGAQTGSEPRSPRRGSNLPNQEAGPSQTIDDAEFSSLQLQGGDTTRHIYRYADKLEREQEEQLPGRLKRSQSVYVPKAEEEDDAISFIQKPGGFRREHIRRTAGSPAPSTAQSRRPNYGTVNRAFTEPARQPRFLTNNFIEFLTVYGHFAGEDLEEDDEVLEADEYFSSDAYDDGTTEGGDDGRSDDGHWGEDSALLTPGKRKRRRKPRNTGKGTPLGAAMLLLKSFVGTGVLFLPRAYLNGGMLFSNLVLLFIALLSYYCFLLLVSIRLAVPASFGDMGGRIFGAYFRNLINFSLVISQIGFSSAYIVFVASNLKAFLLAITRCKATLSIGILILLQMVIFLPLSLYRNINHIQKMALAADLFILLGLLYLYYTDFRTLAHNHDVSDIANFNSASWPLLIGTAIFTFEGVGLVIPIQSSMADPSKFPRVLGIVMIIISVVFISAGALSYAAYGSKTQTVILSNMPQDDPMVNAVQFIYSVAILLSTPLQIYPAIEITSQQLFSRTGKFNPWIKWKKNCFRFLMVAFCALLAWAGAEDLDKFVSVVGSFACIPLVYIYPPMMHYRAVATRTWQKVVDVLLVVFGVAMMSYTTALTVVAWVHGKREGGEGGYC